MLLGCQVRTARGGYIVAFARLDADDVTWADFHEAPRGEPESGGLAELAGRVDEALNPKPTRLALWHFEAPPNGRPNMDSARTTLRAEGLVLSCAGRAGVDVVELSPASQRKRLGVRRNDDAVAALAAQARGSWPVECAPAVAVTVVAR